MFIRKLLLLIFITGSFVQLLFAQHNKWTLKTDDTKLTLGVLSGKLCIFSISDPASKFNWTKIPSVFPLVKSFEHGGKEYTANWIFDKATLVEKNKISFRFTNKNPSMELISEWQARKGAGPVRHTMFIKNLSSEAVTVHEQESMDFKVEAPQNTLRVTYINDDASWTDSIGVYHESFKKDFNKELRISESADWIPFVIIDAGNKIGLYAGWEWSVGRMHLKGTGSSATVQMGNGDHFKTDISPGESLQIPPAFIGTYHGDLDACGNSLRKYLFNYSMPSIITNDTGYPKVEWNAFAATGTKQGSWESLESKYYPMMDDIAPLGFEEVVLDIGWWESYGDPGHIITHKKNWPSGIPAAAKYAHDRKMRFGLYDNESENLTSDSGKSERIRDIAYLINDLHADFYRSDATAGPLVNGAFGSSNRAKYKEDVPYWSIKGFYEVIDSMYRLIPGFSWENCSSGGGLKDYGAVKRSAKIQNQDSYYPIQARQAFNDASYAFHPMQLATIVGSWSEWQATGSVYEFRSACLGAAYWHPDAPNGGNGGPVWTAKQKDDIRRAVDTYKKTIRPLIRSANLYHIYPRPDNKSRDGMQYYDALKGSGIVFIFQPKNQPPAAVILKGLNPASLYKISFEDNSNKALEMSGSALMNEGILVELKGDEASELMYVERVR
jgi:hypothetical protein